MKKYLIVLTIILIVVLTNTSEKVIIPKEAIRFRVIANSDNKIDQKAKKNIVRKLSKDVTKVLENTNSIEEARTNIQNNISNFEKTIEEENKTKNYNMNVDINYGKNYFPEKNYKGVTYKEGVYESLVVTLGEGKGKNFWCVLFPPLCLLEATEAEIEEIEYKSFIKEIIEKYF